MIIKMKQLVITTLKIVHYQITTLQLIVSLYDPLYFLMCISFSKASEDKFTSLHDFVSTIIL